MAMPPNCTRTQLDIASRPGNAESDSTSDIGIPVGKDREGENTHTQTKMIRRQTGVCQQCNPAASKIRV